MMANLSTKFTKSERALLRALTEEAWEAELGEELEKLYGRRTSDDCGSSNRNGVYRREIPQRRTSLKTRRVDAQRVFDDATFTFEDDRFRYEEKRFVTLGLLEGLPVSIVHTERKDRIHIISFRKATKRETTILFQSL